MIHGALMGSKIRNRLTEHFNSERVAVTKLVHEMAVHSLFCIGCTVERDVFK